MEVLSSQQDKRSDEYVREISGVFQFNDDVIRERSFHLLPHSSAGTLTFNRAINSASLPLTSERSSHNPLSRYPQYERVPSRQRCWISSSMDIRAPLPDIETGKETNPIRGIHNSDKVLTSALSVGLPITASKVNRIQPSYHTLKFVSSSKDDIKDNSCNDSPTLGQLRKSSDGLVQREPQLWDEFLLNELSSETAQWLSRNRKTSQGRRERLQRFLGNRGSVTCKQHDNTNRHGEEDSKSQIKTNTRLSAEDRFVNRVNELTEHRMKLELANKKKKKSSSTQRLKHSATSSSNHQAEIDRLNQWNQQQYVEELNSINEAEVDQVFRESTSKSSVRKNSKKDFSSQIVEDLKSSLPYEFIEKPDSQIDDVIRRLAHPEVDVRLRAILSGSSLISDPDHSTTAVELRSKLILGLECCLGDTSEAIKRAAAIVLSVSTDRPSDQVRVVLLDAVQDRCHSGRDGLLAARCLALNEWMDVTVTEILIEELMHCKDTSRKLEIMTYLSAAGTSSSLTTLLLAERLSSERITDRLRAAETLGSLRGSLPMDVKKKLSEMIWCDWNSSVRQAALNVLRHTNHVTTIHDVIMERIHSKEEKVRAEAVRIAGRLEKVPPRLVSKLLRLLEDECSVVREVLCNVSHILIQSGTEQNLIQSSTEKDLIHGILNILSTDSAPSVRLAAARALLRMSVTSPEAERALMRAVCFDREPRLRAECCKILNHLNLINTSVSSGLRDQLTVERDDSVRGCLEAVLSDHGVTTTEDREMSQQVTTRLETLCGANEVTKRVLLSEAERLQSDKRLHIIGPQF